MYTVCTLSEHHFDAGTSRSLMGPPSSPATGARPAIRFVSASAQLCARWRGGVGTPHASLRDAHGATGCGLARGLCSPHARRPDWRCQAARESTADPRRRCARRSLRGQTGASALSRRCEFIRAACRGGCDGSGWARHAPFSGSRTTSVLPGVSSRKPACGLPSFSCHATMFGCAMLPCAGSGGRVCERTGTGAPRERPLLTTSGPCRHPRSCRETGGRMRGQGDARRAPARPPTWPRGGASSIRSCPT